MGKKALIVSDSHGNSVKLNKMIQKEYPIDYIIHCGDGVNDLFQVNIPNGVKVIRVSGNVDLGRGLDIERIEVNDICYKRILVCHGDIYSVQNDFSLLQSEAKKNNADIVFFGHTHIQYCSKDIPILFNPGTANKGLYGVVVFSDGIEFLHKSL